MSHVARRMIGPLLLGLMLAASASAVPGHAYKITATVVWNVNYTVSGAPGGGPLPGITRTATTTVRVAEQQAINSRG